MWKTETVNFLKNFYTLFLTLKYYFFIITINNNNILKLRCISYIQSLKKIKNCKKLQTFNIFINLTIFSSSESIKNDYLNFKIKVPKIKKKK